MRHGIGHSLVRWGSTVTAGAVAAAWLASGYLHTSVVWGHLILTVEAGRVSMLRTAKTTPDYDLGIVVRKRTLSSGWGHQGEAFFSNQSSWKRAEEDTRWRWGFGWQTEGGLFSVPRSAAVPLWMPFFGAGLPAFFWWTTNVNIGRLRSGHCRACGYDRRGLAEGSPCPECGSTRMPKK